MNVVILGKNDYVHCLFGRSEEAKVKNVKCLIGLMLSMVCIVCLSACGSSGEEVVPTVAPAPSASTGDNPLYNAIIDYMNQRDYSIAKTNEVLESYQPQEGQTDYSNLISSLFTPNFKADDELVDLLQSMVELEKTESGFHMTSENGGSGDLIFENGVYQYTFQEQIQEEEEEDSAVTISHSATLLEDSSQLDATTESVQQGGVPILENWLQVKKELDVYQVQQFYTNDGGNTHQLIQMRFSQDELEYAVYENVEEKPQSIFQSDAQFLSDGYITKVTLKDGKVTVNNDGEDLVFGS